MDVACIGWLELGTGENKKQLQFDGTSDPVGGSEHICAQSSPSRGVSLAFKGVQLMQGYIKLHRQIWENEMWFAEKFDRNRAWIDLLLLANHKPSKFIKRGIVISVGRGQLARSMKELADRWQWSMGKVKRQLELWADEKQIEIKILPQLLTVITICNYNTYQDSTTNGKQTETYKNDKNEKKEDTGDFLDLFPQHYQTNTAFKDMWGNWLSYRKEKRNSVTQRSAVIVANKMEYVPVKVAVSIIENSIMQGYTGIFINEGDVKEANPDLPSQELY